MNKNEHNKEAKMATVGEKGKGLFQTAKAVCHHNRVPLARDKENDSLFSKQKMSSSP